jgi:hypothetical protein
MNTTDQRNRNSSNHQAHGLASVVQRMARRTASVVAECNYAERRLTELRFTPDSYRGDTRHAPSVPAMS